MTISPAAMPAPTATAPAGTTAQAGQSLAGDLDSFLRLLTAQLRHQDPLKPTDSTQFVTQLAMFAQAEQGVNTNRRLDTITTMVKGQMLASASAFLGAEVMAPGDRLAFDGASPARFSYTLPSGSESATVEIRDGSGRLVRSVEAKAMPGVYEDAWDGRDADGRPVPAGIYALQVSAKLPGSSGAPPVTRALETKVYGRVEELRVTDGQVMAVVAGQEVPIEAITAVGR
jgi:flagellar basal-body rod modification protein FlgD